jgi:dipeptidyl aminopeptidase/acylaminoacyl peptidase
MLIATTATPALADPAPLIPRDTLFGNPDRAGPQISPDGKRIAYLRPDDKNVLQVWVKTIGQNDDQAITDDPKRGIRQYYWAYDNKHLLYVQDAGGDENFHLYGVDLATRKARDLTPFEGVRMQGLELESKFPDQVILGLNKRNKAVFDAYRLTLSSGDLKLDTENPGTIIGWTTDANFEVRAATAALPSGETQLKVRDKPGAEWKTIRTWSAEEQGSAAGFGTDPNTLYVVGNHDANAVRLLKVDLATGKEEVVPGAEDKEYDIGGVMMEDKTRLPVAVAFTKARTEWKALDPRYAGDLAALAKVRRGDFTITSKTADDSKWLVSYTTDNGPTAYYLYDRPTQKSEFLFVNNSKLEKVLLAQTEPVTYKAKDGLTIHAYLTTPVGVTPKGLPTVLYVHGGPWARDNWGFNPAIQWLANRGYAVLQVNYRGSTGYGKAYLNAGNREWAGKMHQDLIDGVDWLVSTGVADPKKVGIAGGSYGGYATLVGLTFTPEVFACGVDIVGPSSIPTLIKAIPPYWKPLRGLFDKRVGNIDTEEEFLKQRSPLYLADQITKPLLIGQGANDPRVKQAESDQIVAAMRAAKKEVKYVVYPDEGHGFARPENRLHFFAVAEEFLAKHLGGRFEPVGDLKGHTGLIK